MLNTAQNERDEAPQARILKEFLDQERLGLDLRGMAGFAAGSLGRCLPMRL